MSALAAVSYMAVFFAARKFIKNEKAGDIVQRSMIVAAMAIALIVFAIGVAPDVRINIHARAAMIIMTLALLVLAFKAPRKRSMERAETRRDE